MIRAMMRQPFLRVLPVLIACLNHGCMAPYRNEPLQQFDPSAGYRFDALDLGENNSDSLFVCLTLSETVGKCCCTFPAPGYPLDDPRDRVEGYVIDVNFRHVLDEREQERFLAMPTSFALEEEDVDALIEVGRDLVRQHAELRRLLRAPRHNR